MCPMPALTRPLQYLSMNVRMALTSPTTEWRAFSRLTKMRQRLKSPRIWMQKLRPCLPQSPESHELSNESNSSDCLRESGSELKAGRTFGTKLAVCERSSGAHGVCAD